MSIFLFLPRHKRGAWTDESCSALNVDTLERATHTVTFHSTRLYWLLASDDWPSRISQRNDGNLVVSGPTQLVEFSV